MTKKYIDRAVLLFFIVVAVFLYISTADYPGIAKTTSAHYVKFLAVFIGVLSVIQLLLSLVKDINYTRLHVADHLPRFFGLLVSLIIFGSVFEHLGFFISAGIFIPVVALILGYRRYITIVVTTVSVLVFVYLVFVKLLSVNLPGFNF
ncbi:MAG TPA: tripartite tricarboxylate transporter TctB family protein [Psychromonas hadalis]|nr:tripartite tricarboxylate transporter TctB family protein [Psychromonas hadalis]